MKATHGLAEIGVLSTPPVPPVQAFLRLQLSVKETRISLALGFLRNFNSVGRGVDGGGNEGKISGSIGKHKSNFVPKKKPPNQGLPSQP